MHAIRVLARQTMGVAYGTRGPRTSDRSQGVRVFWADGDFELYMHSFINSFRIAMLKERWQKIFIPSRYGGKA